MTDASVTTVELTIPAELAEALAHVHDDQVQSKHERLSSGRGRRGWDTEALSDATERNLDAKISRLLLNRTREEPHVREAIAEIRG
jgi:hypothetical protein